MAYNKVATLMAQVKWSEISAALTKDGRVRLADYADKYGVSIPTMRKMMEQKFGTSVEFRRGRTGGVYPTPDFTKSDVDASTASVNYVPDAPVTVTPAEDAETEAAVDRILGVEA
jgi:hypothetical protein